MDFTFENLTHNAYFAGVPEEYHNYIFEEWRSHGAAKLVLQEGIVVSALKDPEFGNRFLQRAERHGIRMADGHVPWNPQWALNTPEEHREIMLNNNRRALEFCAEAGCTTLTIHVGDNICWDAARGITHEEGRDLLDDSLDKLIPIAEKNKIVLCIENIIAPTDQPNELVRCFKKFKSDYFGCCYDSGHANVMAYYPGKDPEQLCSWIKDHLWRGKPEYYKGNALQELLPYIATCHLHDNNGFEDQHFPAGNGTIRWEEVIPVLKQAPGLRSIQSESSILRGEGFSIREVMDRFRKYIFV